MCSVKGASIRPRPLARTGPARQRRAGGRAGPVQGRWRHPVIASEPTIAYHDGRADADRSGLPTTRLSELVDEVAEVVDGCGRDALQGHDTEQLRQLVGLARRLEGLATVLTATTARALARTGGVAEDGAPSLAAWLQQDTGRSAREAHRVARLATNVRDLPRTAEALGAGRIGAEAADVIVQAARDGTLGVPDEVDAALVPVAETGSPEDLRRHVRVRQQQVEPASLLADERAQHTRRRASMVRADDGMWDLRGRFADEVGTRIRTLMDVFDTPDDPNTPDEQRRTPEQRLADALATAAGAALDHADLPTDGGVTRPHVSVLVDLATLQADLSDPTDADRPLAPDDRRWAGLPPAETPWGSLLSPQAARRMCCDASVSRIVTVGASQVLDVGRATRQWTGPQRRAINARDRGCRGCNRPIAWTEIHHIHWWRNGGKTNLDNGVALCHHCHGLVHDVGWMIQLDPVTAAVTWTSPDRRRTRVTHPRRPS